MKLGRNLLALAAVAAVAFLVGQSGRLAADTDAVAAQYGEKDDKQDPAADEMAKQMEAWAAVGQPGPHHEHLKALEGDWHAVFKMRMGPDEPAMTSNGTVSRKWVLGNRFLQERVQATSDWGTFNGMGFVGYNNFDGLYETVWMDDMGTAIVKSTGTYNPRTRTMSFRGEYRDPASGRIIRSRDTIDLSNPDRHVYTSWMVGENGEEYKHMEGVTERK